VEARANEGDSNTQMQTMAHGTGQTKSNPSSSRMVPRPQPTRCRLTQVTRASLPRALVMEHKAESTHGSTSQSHFFHNMGRTHPPAQNPPSHDGLYGQNEPPPDTKQLRIWQQKHQQIMGSTRGSAPLPEVSKL
jgi:hypothetical protein